MFLCAFLIRFLEVGCLLLCFFLYSTVSFSQSSPVVRLLFCDVIWYRSLTHLLLIFHFSFFVFSSLRECGFLWFSCTLHCNQYSRHSLSLRSSVSFILSWFFGHNLTTMLLLLTFPVTQHRIDFRFQIGFTPLFIHHSWMVGLNSIAYPGLKFFFCLASLFSRFPIFCRT